MAVKQLLQFISENRASVDAMLASTLGIVAISENDSQREFWIKNDDTMFAWAMSQFDSTPTGIEWIKADAIAIGDSIVVNDGHVVIVKSITPGLTPDDVITFKCDVIVNEFPTSYVERVIV